MALLSHFVILGLIVIPSLVLAKGSLTFVLVPEVTELGNSQTMDLLQGYININPSSIGGPIISIVDGTALAAGGDDASAFVESGQSGNGQISTYIVREGDTLSAIAQMFGVSANTIVWANDLKSKTLKIGQELAILPVSGVRHVVKSGDTIATISKKYSANQSDVLAYNGLSTGAKLAVGDEIIIPNGEISTSSGSTNVATKITSGLKEAIGYYLRPLIGGKKSQGIHGYNGVDIAAPTGTAVMAAADGVVMIARASGYNGGYGLYVAIKHDNGTQTVYGHMSKVNVGVGQRVNQGDVIGAVGNTGRSTGAHLHFEVRGARNPF